jgi:hypothetical protein
MTHGKSLRLLVLAGSAVALVACEKPKGAETQATATPSTAVVPLTVTSPYSVNEMMVMIVDRPGELLWNVERAGKAPKSGEDWYQLENHAVELASAATLIQLGGTGPADGGWAADPRWQSRSRELVQAAQSARHAAQAKDYKALVQANGDIVSACEGCHKVFKPDIPTGGLFMRKGAQT